MYFTSTTHTNNVYDESKVDSSAFERLLSFQNENIEHYSKCLERLEMLANKIIPEGPSDKSKVASSEIPAGIYGRYDSSATRLASNNERFLNLLSRLESYV